jgi:hypothetical protein
MNTSTAVANFNGQTPAVRRTGRAHNSRNMPSRATSLPMIVSYRPSCKRPSAAERHSSPAGAGFPTPVWCGA